MQKSKIRQMRKKILILIISIVIAQSAGIIGSFFTAPKIDSWYSLLEKPFFTPPDWLFAPAWITLYALMGVAAFLVWQKKQNPKAKLALCFYFSQLVLNALWSVVFFGLQNPFLGFIVIAVLWLLIFITLIKFWKIDRLAGLLFFPYILWVSFASVLNYFIWQLNL